MITKSDYEQMSFIARNYQGAEGQAPHVRLHASSRPMALDNVFMGYEEFPKIRMGAKYVQVIGAGRWGATLTSPNGQVWFHSFCAVLTQRLSDCVGFV